MKVGANKLFHGELGLYNGVKLVATSESSPVLSDAVQRVLFVASSAVMLTVTWAAPADERYWLLPLIVLLMIFWIVERLIQQKVTARFAAALLGEEDDEVLTYKKVSFNELKAARAKFASALFEEATRESSLLSLLSNIPRK